MIDLPFEMLEAADGRIATRFRHHLDPNSDWNVDGTLTDLAGRLPAGWVFGDRAACRFEDARLPRPLPSDSAAASVAAIASTALSTRLYHLKLVPEFRQLTESMSAMLHPLPVEGGVTDIHLRSSCPRPPL